MSAWAIVLIPTAGGLVVGLIKHFFVGKERHHGVAGIMEAVALAGGRQVLFPHGDTILQPGDVLVAVAEGKAGEIVRQICRAVKELE